MRLLIALVRAMRPQQWTKNLFVLAPVLFENKLHLWGRNQRSLAAFGIFCLLASGIYLINDVLDRELDRLHPRKRNRPIASGELPVGVALAVAPILIGTGLAWARWGLAREPLVWICASYVGIQLLYALWWKRLVIVDVLCISSGFVLRLLAGATASWVTQSTWILVCTIFVSLFLALCKRRHEVVSLGVSAAEHRSALADYPLPLLDQLISVATSATIVTYTLYTVDPQTIAAHRFVVDGRPVPALVATVPFVLFGIFRYLYLVHRRDGGGSPGTTLFRDLPSLVNGVTYLAVVLAIFARFG